MRNIRRALLISTIIASQAYFSLTGANAQQGPSTGDGFDTTLNQLTFAVKGQQVGAWTTGQLSVTGGLSATGAVQIGQTASSCSGVIVGAIRWNPTTIMFEGCNGSVWQPLGGSPTLYAAANISTIYCPSNTHATGGGGGCDNTIYVNGANHAAGIRYSLPVLPDNTVMNAPYPNGVTGSIGWFVGCGIDQGSWTVPSVIWVACQ